MKNRKNTFTIDFHRERKKKKCPVTIDKKKKKKSKQFMLVFEYARVKLKAFIIYK